MANTKETQTTQQTTQQQETQTTQTQQQTQQTTQQPATVTSPEIDYEKLSQLVAGKQSVTEDSVLKGYFKQQGLSKEEMNQAITTFKEQKAAQQPDVGAIQQQADSARQAALSAMIERDAMMLSVDIGIDLKTMPYVLKMADTSQVVGEDGAVDSEKLKEALSKVLEDVPQLKPQEDTQQSGFRQIGVGANNQQTTQQQSQTKPTATKRWNRFN